MMVQEPTSILLVDDSILYHHILTGILAEIGGVKIIGTATNGQLALEKIRLSPPQLVLLDVEMPVMDGLATLEVIRQEYPEITVIMVSGVSRDSADITIKALEMGAFGFVPKPFGTDNVANRETLKKSLVDLIASIKEHGNGCEGKRAPASAAKTVQPPHATSMLERRSPPPTQQIELILIGISTGGPNALNELLPQLPAELGVPILIIQHMPPVFTKSLAESLDRKCRLSVKEAEENDAIVSGLIFIAPGGKHMVVRKSPSADPQGGSYKIGLTDAPAELNCKPSVNVLFRSAAASFSGNILSVVMTGMGTDGCDGVKALKRKGYRCLTQEQKSCTVYGMPKAIVEAGLSDEAVPLRKLAERIIQIIDESKRKTR